MAELCRKCFIETWRPSEYDIAHIIMSDDWDICEGCGNIGPYVDHIGSDEEVYSEAYKQMLKENSENTGLNIFDLMEHIKMNKCKCWKEKQQIVGWYGNEPIFQTIQICNGTKEREVCSCNGNESKCNFYPERKNKKTGKWEVQYVCSVCGKAVKEQMVECPFCHSKMDVRLKRM